jgi:hypothetical protein
MKHKALILLIIGIGVLIGMILFIGPGNIESAIKQANIWYLALAVIVQFIVYGFWTQRWAINVGAVDISIKKRHLFPMLMVGLAINNLTPSARGGGEPIRGYMLSKYSRTSFEKSFATVIADRGLDTFPFVVLAIITIIAAVLYLNLPNWVVYSLIFAVILLLVIFFVAIYMSLNEKAGEKITLWIVGIVKIFYKKDNLENRAINAISGFQNSMRIMIKDKNVLTYGLAISFIIWLFEILRVYIVFSAFGVDVSLIIIAEVFIISSLLGLVPLLPGGLGAVDGIMIILFSAAGVPPSISAAATLVERLISFWMTSIIGMILLPYFGTSVVEKITKKI